MPNIVTDLSVNKDWIARKNAHNTYTITVTQSAAPFNLTSYTFTLNIRKIGASSNAIQLTQGDGITNGGATGILTIVLTQAQTLTLTGESYYYELQYVTSSNTYGFLHGSLLLRTVNTVNATSSLSVNMSLAGTNVTAAVSLSGTSAAAWGSITGTLSNQTDLQTALDARVPITRTVNGHQLNANITITKSNVGLSNADNTSDANKPISTAAQTALDLKAPIASPTFTGIPSAPTPASTDSSTKIATTAFVQGITARRMIYKNNVSSSLTGTLTETIMGSFLIPGNTFGANDIVNLVATFTKSGVAAAHTLRIYFHTSNTISGATLVMTRSPAASATWNKVSREMVFKNAVSSQIVFGATNTGIPSDVAGTAVAETVLSINFAVDQYVILSCQNGSTADTSTLQSWYVETIR